MAFSVSAVTVNKIGLILLLCSSVIPILTYSPVIKAEINYQLNKTPTILIPVDSEFSIIIPKINANTKVIKNVDPNDSQKYQVALTSGVAHALGSATPDISGNTFIFAHSAGNWYQANQYNAVFYLLNKLTPGDEIQVYYQSKLYKYSVSETKIVKNNEVNYLTNSPNPKSLTLMTCWPAGTTLKRLIIVATQLPN